MSEGAEETVQGFILAAGYGRRLRPLTLFSAKPAVLFLNRPLIRYSLDFLRLGGVSDVFVNLHHLPDTVTESLEGEDVEFSFEPEILGTAGAIGNIRDRLTADTLVITNGKVYLEENLDRVLGFHRSRGAWVTLMLVPYPAGSGFNPVWLDEKGNVAGIGPELESRPGLARFAFTGVHVWERKVVDRVGPGISDSVKDIYPALFAEGCPVAGFVTDSYWCESSRPGLYLSNGLDILRRRGLENLIQCDSSASSLHGVIASESVTVGGGCRLRECVLWPDSAVGGGSELDRVIVTSGVRLPPRTRLESAIVTPIPQDQGVDLKEATIAGEFALWPIKD